MTDEEARQAADAGLDPVLPHHVAQLATIELRAFLAGGQDRGRMRLDPVRGAIPAHRLGRDVAFAPKLRLPPDRRRDPDAEACGGSPTRGPGLDGGDDATAEING